MDPFTVFRRMARLQFAAIRLPLDLFEDLVIVRYCDEDAFVRRGFECFLGSMDWCAGQLLDDEYLTQRGDDLLRRTGCWATDDPPMTDDAPVTADAPVTDDTPATDYTPAAADTPATDYTPAAADTPATDEPREQPTPRRTTPRQQPTPRRRTRPR